MKADKKVILKALVGSQAHGLATPTSDFDYRGVFIIATDELLKVNPDYDCTSWIEGKEDNTAHEVRDFLQLAIHSNPSVLETLVSPVIEENTWGAELRELFPYIWNSKGVYEAFSGYSCNQRKKFLEDKDARPWKYATAYIRVLLLGIELLRHGTMTVNLADQEKILGRVAWMEPQVDNLHVLKFIKEGTRYSKGSVIDVANMLQGELKNAYEANPNKTTDMDKVNEFLRRLRYGNRTI
jgi:hypothetical protein